MVKSLLSLLLLVSAISLARAQTPSAAEVEQTAAEAIKSEGATIVHFWAPWCPNCKAELTEHGWKAFIDANPDVHFVFVTVWSEKDGRSMLEQAGVGPQKNFTLLVHPNGSRKKADKVSSFLGLPLTWIPTTWVFKAGALRYAMNYGEVDFPTLQKFVGDSSNKWKH